MVLLLRPRFLAFDYDACGQVFELHGGAGLVDFLAAWAGAAKEGDGEVGGGDWFARGDGGFAGEGGMGSKCAVVTALKGRVKGEAFRQ